MNIQNRQQFLGIVAGIAVAAWAMNEYAVKRLTALWTTRSERVVSLRKSVDTGQNLLARETGLRETWHRMRTNTLAADVSAADSQMLRAFDAWSRDSGVAIGGLRPQWKRSDNDLQTLEYRADVSGNLPSLSRFLYLAETDPLGIRIESVELTARDKNGDQIALALLVSGLQLRPSSSSR